MSYFNHAYRKSFVGTKVTQAGSGTAKAVNEGFLIESGVHSGELSNTAAPFALGKGTFGFFDPNTYVSVVAGSPQVAAGKPLVLAAASLMSNDKIGPFHGGYAESNKSKMINPKFIHKFLKMTPADAEQAIIHVGNTNLNKPTAVITTGGIAFTDGVFTDVATTGGTGTGLTVNVTIAAGIVTSVTVNKVGTGYISTDVVTITDGTATTDADFTLTVFARCNLEFLCNESYNLGLTLGGSPVLRFLNHRSYRTYAAYTGCCTGAAPANVDSTLVMINWANQIIEDRYTKDFVRPVVYTEEGNALFATAAEALAAGYTALDIWTTYVSPGHVAGKLAGIRLVGAYVSSDADFTQCSFQKTDFFEKEVVKIIASMTDLSGNPCSSALCISVEHEGFQGQGFGDTILKNIILDETYLTNHFHDDIRLREINQGDQIGASINRFAKYTRYVIQHTVPRYNNASGIHDNDQYALNIYVPAVTATSFEVFVATWLAAANTPVTLDVFGHTASTPISI